MIRMYDSGLAARAQQRVQIARQRVVAGRHGDGQALRRAPQPFEVPVEMEGPAAVRPQRLVDGVAEREAVVQHGDARLFGRRDLPVDGGDRSPLHLAALPGSAPAIIIDEDST